MCVREEHTFVARRLPSVAGLAGVKWGSGVVPRRRRGSVRRARRGPARAGVGVGGRDLVRGVVRHLRLVRVGGRELSLPAALHVVVLRAGGVRAGRNPAHPRPRHTHSRAGTPLPSFSSRPALTRSHRTLTKNACHQTFILKKHLPKRYRGTAKWCENTSTRQRGIPSDV